MNLEVVIGLEIHVQISTKTKLFVRVSNDSFDKAPNINTSPFCMGFPGLLPVLNKEAVYKSLKAALALNCKIAEYSKFDRKNYFYPDNPKGYQISQFDEPFSLDGHVEVEVNGKQKKIGVNRLHIEDDAGKLTHIKNYSLIDFNRAGSPLMEIVSEPDMRSSLEAVAYAKEVQKIVRYVDAADADMEKGMMRFDASVSMRPVGDKKLYPRSEIKNLNSFKALEAAIDFEVERQQKLWQANSPQESAVTLGWDDSNGKTYFMREKEDSDDYRYFPEPDIPPLHISKDLVNEVKSKLPELPRVKFKKYIDDFGLPEDDARILSEDLKLAIYFEELVALGADVKLSTIFINSVMLKFLKEDLIGIEEQKISAKDLFKLIKLVEDNVVSLTAAKGEVFEEMYDTGKDADVVIEEKGLKQISDDSLIEELVEKIISENSEVVEQIKAGKDKAKGFLVGQVMKESKGKANPQMVNEILKKYLN